MRPVAPFSPKDYAWLQEPLPEDNLHFLPVSVAGRVVRAVGSTVLDLPQHLLGYAATQLAPPGQEFVRTAVDQGVKEAWNRPGDQGGVPIPQLAKMGLEIGAGLVTPGIGSIGPVAGITKTITSPLTRGVQNIVKAVPNSRIGVPQVIQNKLGVNLGPGLDTGWLFREGNTAKEIALRGEVADLRDYVTGRYKTNQQLIDELTNPYFNNPSATLRGVQAPTTQTWARLQNNLGLSDAQMLYMRDMISHKVSPKWTTPAQQYAGLNTYFKKTAASVPQIPEEVLDPITGQMVKTGKMVDDPVGLFNQLFNNSFINQKKTNLGISSGRGLQGPGWYTSTNDTMRELMMTGGFTWVPNLLSIASSAQMAGIGGKQIILDARDIIGQHGGMGNLMKKIAAQDPSKPNTHVTFGVTRELQKLLGPDKPPSRLGLDFFSEFADRKGLITKASMNQMVTGGAGIGLISGGAPAALAGGAVGGLTKIGSVVNDAGMRLFETVGRGAFFTKGIKDYFRENETTILNEFTSRFGAQGANLVTDMKTHNYFIDPDNVAILASARNIDGPTAKVLWKNIREKAFDQGIELSNKHNFIYNRPTPAIELMRNFTPFPIWPAANLPYYAEKFTEHPILPVALSSYFNKNEAQSEDGDLPRRVSNRLPIASLFGTDWYANPIAPMAVSSQLAEGPPQTPNSQYTGIDRAVDTLGMLGFGVNPILNYAATAAGGMNRGSDFQDILPNTRLVRPLAQAITGQTFDPEAVIKGLAGGVRSSLDPSSMPETSYPEYLVKKKLADLSIMRTGKPWYENSDYQKAMVDNSDELYIEATRLSGLEQSSLYGLRRLIPLQLSTLGHTEKNILQQRNTIPFDPTRTPDEWEELRANHPVAFGYQDIGKNQRTLELTIKLQYYQTLNPTSQLMYRIENPELDVYLKWSQDQVRKGAQPDIKSFLGRDYKKITYPEYKVA